MSATAIYDGAFDGTSVTSFTFGPELATIGDLALRSPQLASISFTADNPNFDMENGILFNEGKTTMIICPAKNAVHDLVLPDTLVNILHYAAYGSSISGTLTLPDSITFTGTRASRLGTYYSDLTDSTPNYQLVPWYAPSSNLSVIFSAGIEEIDAYMFYHPSTDTTITSIYVL